MESAFGGGLLTCGSWVLHALENLPNLKKAVLVGPADEDKTAEQLLKDSRITWVTEAEFEQQKEALCKELSKWPVYISLDKDVLNKEEAVTDWSQGTMQLSQILCFLTDAKKSGAIFLGMDCLLYTSGEWYVYEPRELPALVPFETSRLPRRDQAKEINTIPGTIRYYYRQRIRYSEDKYGEGKPNLNRPAALVWVQDSKNVTFDNIILYDSMSWTDVYKRQA